MPHKSPGGQCKAVNLFVVFASTKSLRHRHRQHPYNDVGYGITNPRFWEANHRSIASQHEHFASSFSAREKKTGYLRTWQNIFWLHQDKVWTECRMKVSILCTIHRRNASIKLPRGLWPNNIVTCIFILSPHQNKFQVGWRVHQREWARDI